MRRTLLALSLVPIVSAAAWAFKAACDVEIQGLEGSASIRGSIRDARQCEDFRMFAPRGAAVSATAKASGATAPSPTIRLTNLTDGHFVDGTPSSRGQKLAMTLESDGNLLLHLTGDGAAEGDYGLGLKVKPKTRWDLADTAVAMTDTTASFAAPAGAIAHVNLRAASKSSPFVPSLTSITGPSGFVATLGGGGSSGAVKLGDNGEYLVHFAGGVAGGAWSARVDVAPVRRAATKLDLTDRTLTGDPTTGTPVSGRIVGTDGGFVQPGTSGTAIDGCRITLPAGALAAPTLVIVAGGPRFGLPAGVHAKGPFVRFAGPSGDFAAPATATLFFDNVAIADPLTELTIYERPDSGGAPVALAKPYVLGGGIATLEVAITHPGTLVATTANPRVPHGQWKLLRFSNDAQDGYVGSVTCTLSAANVGVGHMDVLAIDGARATWTPGVGDTATAASSLAATSTSGAFDVVDDASMTFADTAASRTLTFVRGFGDHALVSAGKGKSGVTGLDVPQLDLLLENGPTPTAPGLVGRWNFFLLAAGGANAAGGKVLLASHEVAGTMTLVAGGTAKFTTKGGRRAASDFPLDGSGWDETAAEKIATGTWSLALDHIVVGFTLGTTNSVDLYGVMDGRVLVGRIGNASGNGTEIGFVIAAREGAGMTATQLDGTNATMLVVESLRERVVQDQGYGIAIGRGTTTRTAKSADLASFNAFSVEHDLNTGVAFGLTGGVGGRTFAFSLTASGRYAATDGVAGLVAPHGDLLIGARSGDHFVETTIELPSVEPQ